MVLKLLALNKNVTGKEKGERMFKWLDFHWYLKLYDQKFTIVLQRRDDVFDEDKILEKSQYQIRKYIFMGLGKILKPRKLWKGQKLMKEMARQLESLKKRPREWSNGWIFIGI